MKTFKQQKRYQFQVKRKNNTFLSAKTLNGWHMWNMILDDAKKNVKWIEKLFHDA